MSKYSDPLTPKQAYELGLSGDAIADKNWKNSWQNHPNPEIQERFQTANDYYVEQGFNGQGAIGHLRGINFNREVGRESIEPGQSFLQYQTPEQNSAGGIGNYFTDSASKEKVGIQGDSISSQNRVPEVYIAERETESLKSTAADIESWNGSGELYYGGGKQYHVSEKEALSKFIPPESTNGNSGKGDKPFDETANLPSISQEEQQQVWQDNNPAFTNTFATEIDKTVSNNYSDDLDFNLQENPASSYSDDLDFEVTESSENAPQESVEIDSSFDDSIQ